MRIKSYSICKPVKGICKQDAIWAMDADSNATAPLIYLQRPKWITDDHCWNDILSELSLRLPLNFEVN